jgi:uncharacterized protein YgbK (DUF1537 family)
MAVAHHLMAQLECFLIADDLTGANDSAVQFALQGRRTRVCLSPEIESSDAEVLAVNTATRNQRLAQASACAEFPRRSARILFQKIDSTLRGNVGAQIGATLQTFAYDAAIVCSAFPALNRVVESGSLRVTDTPDFVPVSIVARLQPHRCVHVQPGSIERALASGATTVSLDAVCDQDLDDLAAEGLSLDKRILWVGSGGLAAALARALPPVKIAKRVPLQIRGPVLFCIGSDHPRTLAQQREFVGRRNVHLVSWEHAKRESIIDAMHNQRDVCLQISVCETHHETLSALLSGVPAAALFLAGGDTAALVCEAVGVRNIDLHGEISPGIPFGVLNGGGFDGVSVVTKSGAFGPDDALIQVADHFSCSQN